MAEFQSVPADGNRIVSASEFQRLFRRVLRGKAFLTEGQSPGGSVGRGNRYGQRAGSFVLCKRDAVDRSGKAPRTVLLRRDGQLCRQRDVIREGMPDVAPAEITDRPSVGTLDFQPVFACNGIGAQIVDLHLQTVLIAGKSGRKQRIANGLSVELSPRFCAARIHFAFESIWLLLIRMRFVPVVCFPSWARAD